MKSINLKALFLLYAVILGSGLLQSCCDDRFRIISATHFNILQTIDESYVLADTIRGEFTMEVILDYRLAQTSKASLINSAYATSCIESFVNTVNKESLSLITDHAIVFNKDTIPAGYNILQLINSGIEVENYDGHYLGIFFPQSFFDNSFFEDGDYYFKFEGRTDDNIQLIVQEVIPVRVSL
jgi:hypothetical protein